MLLVDNNQAEILKRDSFLHERVRPNAGMYLTGG